MDGYVGSLTEQGLRLNRAFMKIEDPVEREKIIEAAERAANTSDSNLSV